LLVPAVIGMTGVRATLSMPGMAGGMPSCMHMFRRTGRGQRGTVGQVPGVTSVVVRGGYITGMAGMLLRLVERTGGEGAMRVMTSRVLHVLFVSSVTGMFFLLMIVMAVLTCMFVFFHFVLPPIIDAAILKSSNHKS
jgi:hypothetical protein